MSEKTTEVSEFALRTATFSLTMAALGQGQNFSMLVRQGWKTWWSQMLLSTYQPIKLILVIFMAFLFLGFLQSFSVLKFCLHLWWFQLPVKKLLSKAASKGDTWTGIFIKFCRQLFSVIPLITHIKSWKNIQVESDAFLLLMNFPLPNNST